MSETTTMTVRLDASLKIKLEALAQSTQRNKSWLAAEAIAAYVDQEAWQIQQIEAAVEQANHAEWVDHKAVSTWLKTWGNDNETTTPCLSFG